MTGINPRLLANAVQARLEAQLPGIPAYVGEALNVPLVENGDGRVVQYYVLSFSAGTPGPELDLADTVVDLDWSTYITVAGPTENDVLQLAHRIHTALYRWKPTVEGVNAGPLRPPPGADAQVVLDKSVQPHRPFLQLQYSSSNTTAPAPA